MSQTHHTTVRRLLSRRNLLRHTTLAALLTPVVRMRDAEAAPAPRRVIFVYSGNGPHEVVGPASGTTGTSNFTLHDWWKPLERHRADGIFMSHMAVTGTGQVPGNAHGLGGSMYSGCGADDYANRGETVDQVIAKRLEGAGRGGAIRSVVWGLSRGATGTAFSAGSHKDIEAELNPQNAWKTMFAQFVPPSMGTNAAAALLRRKKSVLDFVNQDCKSFASALGTDGVRLLDDHCSRLRSMEQSLGLEAPVTSSCGKPGDPGTKSWTDPENVDAQMDAFADLITKSLACELTHVVGFQISGQAARNRLAASYGVPSSAVQSSSDDVGPAHHPWTHDGARSQQRTAALRIFTSFYAAKVALLLDKLKATVDASGKPLLDSTMVLWLCELGGSPKNIDAHNTGCTPALLFGGGQGTFKTGRYLRGKSAETEYEDWKPTGNNIESGRDMAKILVSMIHYMGFTDVNTIGQANANGPFMPLYG